MTSRSGDSERSRFTSHRFLPRLCRRSRLTSRGPIALGNITTTKRRRRLLRRGRAGRRGIGRRVSPERVRTRFLRHVRGGVRGIGRAAWAAGRERCGVSYLRRVEQFVGHRRDGVGFFELAHLVATPPTVAGGVLRRAVFHRSNAADTSWRSPHRSMSNVARCSGTRPRPATAVRRLTRRL